MPNPVSALGIQPGPIAPLSPPASGGAAKTADGKSFHDMLMDSLSEVNRLQQEATQGVEKFATGETQNVAEVLTAVRKADVAFSMLMEMRNKLVDAYQELQQMRI